MRQRFFPFFALLDIKTLLSLLFTLAWKYCCCPFRRLHDNDILSIKAASKKLSCNMGPEQQRRHTWMRQFLVYRLEIVLLPTNRRLVWQLYRHTFKTTSHFWENCFPLGFNRPPSGHFRKILKWRDREREREGREKSHLHCKRLVNMTVMEATCLLI